MTYFRIYTGPDGLSYFEDLEIPLHGAPNGSAYSALVPATGVIFRRTPADQYLDWHPAPRRQFVITLKGEAELVASGGETRRVGPGSIMLAEDTTGKGHRSRAIGGAVRHCLFIPID